MNSQEVKMDRKTIIKEIEDKVVNAWQPVRTEFASYLTSKTRKELQRILGRVAVSPDGKDIRLY